MTSETQSQAKGNAFARNMLPIMKEYQQKLVQIRSEITGLSVQLASPSPGNQPQLVKQRELQQLQYSHNKNSFNAFDAQLQDFIRSVSQQIEHGVMDEVLLIELRLRLGEFERELLLTRSIVASA